MLKKENLKLVSQELEEYWEGEMHSAITFSIGPNITRKHLRECGITEFKGFIVSGRITVVFTEDEIDIHEVILTPVYWDNDYGYVNAYDAEVLIPRKDYIHIRAWFFELINRLSR